MEIQTQVLIVGAGPTGLVAALALTKIGVSVRIIDQNENAGTASRAIIIHAHTLEHYLQLGISQQIINAGIKVETATVITEDHTIINANIGDFGKGLSPFPFLLTLPQDDHEKLLIAELASKNIFVERNTEFLSATQNENSVTAILRKGPHTEYVETHFLCGCDGAHSAVRKALNLDFKGGSYSQIFYVADVGKPSDYTQTGFTMAISATDFTLVFPVRSSNTLRLIGIVPSEYHDKQISFNDVNESVIKNTKLKIDNVNWFSSYHVHHRVAEKFSQGNMFLLGDAAHIHSPAGGQGMNTGIGDAMNLAWKLANVLNNNATKNLLITYESERRPFANKLVATTDRAFTLMTDTTWIGNLWRKYIFPNLIKFVFSYTYFSKLFFKFISQIEINYRKSELSSGSVAKLKGGDRLPWTGNNYEPLTSLKWHVQVYGKPKLQLTPTLNECSISLYEFPWTEQHEQNGFKRNSAYLIRPDGYISVIDENGKGEPIKEMLIDILSLNMGQPA
ncbi:MAG: FAD-dependent monooxygenase [Gammaproteobacteria bacterium]|nr:FAD-dependent monooxygenase [Gammaproteobacteria bacterium]